MRSCVVAMTAVMDIGVQVKMYSEKSYIGEMNPGLTISVS